MKERPILFSAPMVRAILEGTKTQTRRVANKLVRHPDFGYRCTPNVLVHEKEPQHVIERANPYGQPGDRLWVREAWRAIFAVDHMPPRDLNQAHRIWYEADAPHQPGEGKLRPSMFMPRWASRILLEIVSVRVERLQEITNDDARAEGPEYAHPHRHGTEGLEWEPHPGEIVRDPYAARHNTGWNDCWICAYRQIWQDINGPASWDADPFVWVVEFKRVEMPA